MFGSWQGDPSRLGDIMPVGFGDEGGGVIVDEFVEEGAGRRWNDHGSCWVGKEGKKDGFVSTLTRSYRRGSPSGGDRCRKVDIEAVDVRSTGVKGSENDPEKPDAWEKEIGKAGKGGTYIFSDGSLLEGENVGGGAFIIGPGGPESEVECGIGNVATVWDGEVGGMGGRFNQGTARGETQKQLSRRSGEQARRERPDLDTHKPSVRLRRSGKGGGR